MATIPEASPESLVAEILGWVAYERDAAWAAKLAILRLERREDIAHFATCLREHDRHTDELAQLLRAAHPRLEVPREPCFVTRDPHVVGALDDADAVLAAMTAIEEARVARYEGRRPRPNDEPHRMLDGLLERHALDARRRLAWLSDRRRARSVGRMPEENGRHGTTARGAAA